MGGWKEHWYSCRLGEGTSFRPHLQDPIHGQMHNHVYIESEPRHAERRPNPTAAYVLWGGTTDKILMYLS